MAYITNDKDRNVKVFNNGVAVSNSKAQSEYARKLNFIGGFSIVVNTISNENVYDITNLGYAIPKEGGVDQGSTARPLNFTDAHFDIAEVVGNPGSYDISSTGWVKVNSFTVKPLNIINATGNEAVTAAEGTSTINLTFNNDEVNVYGNGTLVTAAPRAVNFDTNFTVTDDSGNDRVNIGLASGFIPKPYITQSGWIVGNGGVGGADGEKIGGGLLECSIDVENSGDISTIISTTHKTGIRLTSGGSDGDGITIWSKFGPITRLDLNQSLKLKFSIPTKNQYRIALGLIETQIDANNDNFIPNQSGVIIGGSTDTDTAWQIFRNSGDATVTKATTGVAMTAGAIVTFELRGNNASSRWEYSINGAAFVNLTTDIPTTQGLRFVIYTEEIGSTPQDLDVFYAYIE